MASGPDLVARQRILVVEDDATVAEVLRRYLERDGFEVEWVEDGETGVERVQASPPDLIVIDVMLPGINGFEVCDRIRSWHVPSIMLTARGEESDRIMGLELGADDYVVKPFSPRELVARVKTVLRRSSGSGAPDLDEPLTSGDLEVDRRARIVRIAGNPVALTTREYDLLVFLMEHPRTVFRREQLLEQVWGYTFGGTPTVTVHVQRLRRKIEPDPERPTRIATVWGAGYRFDG